MIGETASSDSLLRVLVQVRLHIEWRRNARNINPNKAPYVLARSLAVTRVLTLHQEFKVR